MRKLEQLKVEIMDCEGIDEIFVNRKTYKTSEIYEGKLGEYIGFSGVLIFFANMKEHLFSYDDLNDSEDYNERKYLPLYHEVVSRINNDYSTDSVDEYLSALLDELENSYGESIADIIMIDTVNSHLKRKFKDIKNVREQILKNLSSLISMAQSFVELNYSANQIDETGRDRKFLYPLAFDVFAGVRKDISYGAIMGRKNEDFVVIDIYSISSATSVLEFLFILMIKENVVVKICENCRRFFIPSTRSDEIYCEYINENGRSCKEIGFENKIKKDIVLKTYRTIYKTQNARKQRNSHLPDINSRFEKWAAYAKLQLEMCRKGDITVEEMKQVISGSDWLSDK